MDDVHLGFSPIYIRIIITLLRLYSEAKNKVNPPNRFRDIHAFHVQDGLREKIGLHCGHFRFLNVINIEIYYDMQGYIHAKNEVNLPNRIQDIHSS